MRPIRNTIGRIGTQPAAVDHVGAEPRLLPKQIGDAGRRRYRLRVVGEDVVVGDIGEIVGVDQILVGCDIGALLLRDGNVPVSSEIADVVVGLDLDALVIGFRIVEPVEHKCFTELPIVEQIARNLVVAVDPHLETGDDALDDANVEIVRALGKDEAAGRLHVRRLPTTGL